MKNFVFISPNFPESYWKFCAELKNNGRYEIDADMLAKLQSEFYGSFCDDETGRKAIKEIFEERNYLFDTHTAVALAAYLKADRCQIFTDVDGVYDRDPRRYTDAIRFGQISYEKMLRLIGNGAQVLHDRSVELARRHNIQVEVLSAFTGAPGTIVG